MTEAEIMIKLLEQTLERLKRLEQGLIEQPEQLSELSKTVKELSEADGQRESFQLKLMKEQQEHMRVMQESAAQMGQAQAEEIERLREAVSKLEQGSQAAQRFGKEAVEVSRFLSAKTLGASMTLGGLVGVLSMVLAWVWMWPQLTEQLAEQLASDRASIISQCMPHPLQSVKIEESSPPKPKTKAKRKAKPR